MEFKFPVVQAESKEYTAEELYGKLSQEDSGYYLLSANQFWHGGVHFTSKHFAQHITDVPIQAIAKGTVIAYRINKNYLLIKDDEVLAVPPEKGGYQYSSGFCLIKHTIPYERKKTEEEKQQEIQQQVQQTTEQLKDQQITVQGSSPRTYRNEEGTKAASEGTYPVGTKLDIISVSDTAKDGYYFAKVREAGKTAATDEHYIALLDKTGKPLANKDGKAFFELPVTSTATTTEQQSAEQTTQNTNTQTSETTPTDTSNSQTGDTKKQEPQPTTFNLEFYSLYMHLCAYEDYLPKKENEQQQKTEIITIKASGLRVRDKQRDEANCAILGIISNGATLEVLESKVSHNKQFTDVKGKIISGTVKNGNNEIAKAGDTVWVPTKQGNKSFIKDNKQPTPKEKTRPSYWQGTVTAKVKKADGITIWKTYENNELKTELGKINQGNQFTFDSTQAKTISQTGKPDLLVAECTPIGTFTFRGNGEKPTGTFWTTVDKDSITREKVEPTVFDTVVPCQVEVIAEESLGYLGIYETPSKMCEINKKRQVHVEIFTPDLKTVEFLLNNPFKLTGKKYIKIAKGTQLLGQLPIERPVPAIPAQTTPAPQANPIPDYTVTRDHYLAIDTLKAKKQLNGKEWYEIAVEKHTGYLAKEGLEEIDQHQWAKLGFQLVQEDNTNADGYLDPNLMPPIFQQIYNKIDTSGDKKLDQNELKAALQNQEIRDQWSKLIAYHPSEWRTDTRAIIAKFTQLLTNALAPSEQQAKANKLLLQEIQRMTSLAFLEKVTPPIPPMLYHFHPVAFVEFMSEREGVICKECGKSLVLETSFLKAIAPKAKDQFVNDFSDLSRTLFPKYGINTCSQVQHLLAQSFAETTVLTSFRESLIYTTKSYTPTSLYKGRHTAIDAGFKRLGMNNLTEAEKIEYVKDHLMNNDAGYANHCFGSNDYPNNDYRGRGLLHLTFPDTYKKCAKAIGIDIYANPQLLETDSTAIIESGLWYWKERNIAIPANNRTVSDDQAVKNVTKLINTGLDNLAGRQKFKKDITAEFIRRYGQCTRTASPTTDTTGYELSGRSWVSRFPTSTSLDDLDSPFKENATDFISALRNAGANVSISTTYRPPKRAFLMHYAFTIENGTDDPRNVPHMDGVDINWVHTDANGNYSREASIQAAREMKQAYGIVSRMPPSLNTRHTARNAVDMTITWTGTLNILNASGQNVAIRTTPRTGSGNIALHAVGASYGLHKLANDPPHWSDNGH